MLTHFSSRLNSALASAFPFLPVLTLVVAGAAAQGSQRTPVILSNTAGSGTASARATVEGSWPHFTAVWPESGFVSRIASSHDGGVTWAPSIVLAGATNNVRIARHGDHAVLAYRHHVGAAVFAHTSSDNGMSWTPALGQPGNPVSDAGLSVILNSMACVAAGNKFFVAFIANGSLFIDEASVTSPTWGTDLPVAPAVAHAALAAADGVPGRIGVAWRKPSGTQDLEFAQRDIGGSAFSTPVTVQTAVQPQYALAATSSGGAVDFHALYVGGSTGTLHAVRYATSATGFAPTQTVGAINIAGAQGGSLLDIVAAPDSSQVHAFYADFVPAAPNKVFVRHRSISTQTHLAGPANNLSGTIGLGIEVPSPRGFVDGEVVGCTWDERFTANPTANARDPLYNLSVDGGANWFSDPKTLIPGPLSFSTDGAVRAHACASRSSIVTLYTRTPAQLEVVALTTYGVLPIAPTGNMDDPFLFGDGLPLQDPSAITPVRFGMLAGICSTMVPAYAGLILISAGGPPAVQVFGACNLVVSPAPLLSGVVISASSPGFTAPLNLPAGTSLVGLPLRAQGFVLGSPCGSDCVFDAGVSMAPSIECLITIL